MTVIVKQDQKIQLNREVIVDAVLELATEGDEEVTYKQLGVYLGVDSTAMYRHFRNKEELIRACLDRLHGVVAAVTNGRGGTWRERIETYAFGILDIYAEHPAVGLHGIMYDPQGQGENDAIELILEALIEGGTDTESLIEIYGAISGLMLSYGSVAAQWNLKRAKSVTPSATWISDLGHVDPTVHPRVYEYRDDLLTVKFRDIFRRALGAILDSIDSDHIAHERGSPLPE